ASIGNPWIFNEIKHYLKTGEHLAKPSVDERVNTCLKHLDFSIKWKGEKVGNVEMRRHYANYFKGFPDFKPFRMRLVTNTDNSLVRELLEDVRVFYKNSESYIPIFP
ncbi:tRNA-dihydrouridine synthase, partial [Bacteroidota bacterium]